MRNPCSTRFLCEITSNHSNVHEFYDPLTPSHLIKKKIAIPKHSLCFRAVFDDEENQQNIFDRFEKQKNTSVADDPASDEEEDIFLKKILANSKNNKKVDTALFASSSQTKSLFEPYSFDKKIQIKYPETPHFKNQLLSPFWKFNKDNRNNIETLQKNFSKGSKSDYTSIELNQDPLLYVSEPSKYFIGLALKMKEKDMIVQSLMFLKLACYTQPYNDKVWKKYIEMIDHSGDIKKSFFLSKTAFLFCPTEQLAKLYILNGQKCAVPIEQLKGIITNVNNPDLFEKGILVDIGKFLIKSRENWKGFKILFQICVWNEFKLPVCTLIHFLAKTLDNFGQTDKALAILRKSFAKNMSKLQIYTLYLQIINREQKGQIKETAINEIIEYAQSISDQNRYKLYLEIGQILFKQKNQRYQSFIERSYIAAKSYCAPGTGCNKALRHIFFSVLRWKRIIFPLQTNNDLTAFQTNRQNYIIGKSLTNFQFSDWKCYLHYGLEKRDDSLAYAMNKWPYTGRLIAEWIHCLRVKKPVLQVLKLWREKIRQVPKSGELWCEGGRIYAQLKDYENASKCFRAAIHFTPQYGDSFLQQLKILLIKGKFRQIYKLKKMMVVLMPFYGHVWSYLRSFEDLYKFSLSNLWQAATNQIKQNLYFQNSKIFRSHKPYSCERLTAISSYNKAVQNPISQQIRIRLFNSYQQNENRN